MELYVAQTVPDLFYRLPARLPKMKDLQNRLSELDSIKFQLSKFQDESAKMTKMAMEADAKHSKVLTTLVKNLDITRLKQELEEEMKNASILLPQREDAYNERTLAQAQLIEQKKG